MMMIMSVMTMNMRRRDVKLRCVPALLPQSRTSRVTISVTCVLIPSSFHPHGKETIKRLCVRRVTDDSCLRFIRLAPPLQLASFAIFSFQTQNPRSSSVDTHMLREWQDLHWEEKWNTVNKVNFDRSKGPVSHSTLPSRFKHRASHSGIGD